MRLKGLFTLHIESFAEVDDIPGFPPGIDVLALGFTNAPLFPDGTVIEYVGSVYIDGVGHSPQIELEVTGSPMYVGGKLEIHCRTRDVDELVKFIKILLQANPASDNGRMTFEPPMKFEC